MRYFLSGFGLFILLTVFVRSWYIQQRNQPKEQIVTINTSPVSLEGETNTALNSLYSDKIILEDNLLLKTTDYETLNQLVLVMHQYSESNLTVSFSENIDTAKIENIFGGILADQGVLETRIHFLRKPFKLSNGQMVLLSVQ